MEIKDIVISIIVPLAAALMSYFGSRRGTKVARKSLRIGKRQLRQSCYVWRNGRRF